MSAKWFAIVNPISGRGKSLKKLQKLKQQFTKYDTNVIFQITGFAHHEKILAQKAIENGFTNIISIGGDGTLHHIINGIMNQKIIDTSKITVAVIPFGTGNDWVKTYNITKNIDQCVINIINKKTIYQDIGVVKFTSDNKIIYFNNVAGVGFDAFVVHKIASLKGFGTIAYLLGAIISFFSYKESMVKISINDKFIELPLFMLNIGLCKYSGGGMQLTDYNNHKKGSFDISLMRHIKLLKVLFHINYLFNGKLKNFKEVQSLQNNEIKVLPIDTHKPFIQADGEVLGTGEVSFKTIPKAIQFVIP